jgi:hypothetical protein
VCSGAGEQVIRLVQGDEALGVFGAGEDAPGVIDAYDRILGRVQDQ